MKYILSLYRYLFAGILLLMGWGSVAAQQVQLRLINESLNCATRQMAVSLEIRSDGDPINLGTSSILLEYNQDILRFSNYEPVGFEPTFTCGAAANGWAKQVFDGTSQLGILNITAHLTDTAGSCPQLYDEWIKFGTIFFEIKQPGKDPGVNLPIDFSVFNSAVNDGQTLYGRGTVEIEDFTPGICNDELTQVCEPIFAERGVTDFKQWSFTQNAKIVEERITLTNNTRMYTSLGKGWEDITLELTTIIRNTATGITFRYNDPTNHYLLRLESRGDKVSVWKRLGNNLSEIISVNMPIGRNTEYQVKVTCLENQFEVYLDGEMIMSFTDDSFGKGSIGFSVNNGESAEYDNVAVCQPESFACEPVSLTNGPNVIVSQSSRLRGQYERQYAAEKAIDGDLRGDPSLGTVALTKEEWNPWWEIDLGAIKDISFLRIWNRDDCCQHHLRNAYIFISEFPFESQDLEATRNQSGVTHIFEEGGLGAKAFIPLNQKGRYIRIQLSEKISLQLAEVEVIGCEKERGGLLSTYYYKNNLTEPIASRIDRNINFVWPAGVPPHTALRTELYSVRWQGDLVPPITGTIKFRLKVDDGARLWIDNKEVINHWAKKVGYSIVEGKIDLVAGEKVPIQLEYYNLFDAGQITLMWQYEGVSWHIVPPSFLIPRYGGLLATYYGDTELTIPLVTRIDREVNYNWKYNAPHPAVPRDFYSVKWEGTITPRYSERYMFATYTDDGVRLWVNDELIIDDWRSRPNKAASGFIDLEAGQPVPIRMEYFERNGRAEASLQWKSRSQPQEVVPSSVLNPTSTELTMGEVGQAQVTNEWRKITLERSYLDPVVIIGGITSADDQPVTARIRQVTGNSFEIALLNWPCENRAHEPEFVPYMVLESGYHLLPNGGAIYAGHIFNVTNTTVSKDFPTRFAEKPVVLANAAGYAGRDLNVVKVRSDHTKMYVYVREGESYDNRNAQERVDFIACTPGSFNSLLDMKINRTEAIVKDSWRAISLGLDDDQDPIFLGGIGTVTGGDPAVLRYRQVPGSGGVEVRVQEERCRDNETAHAFEEIHYLTFARTGLIELPAFQAREGKFLVDGLYLYAYPEGERIQLEWTVDQEQNIEAYVIESSVDKQFFSNLLATPSLGDSESPRTYEEWDDNPLEGVNYYRVKAIGKDGTTVYSNTVRTSIENLDQIFAKIYPNPIKQDESLEISVQVPDKEWVELSLFTPQGQQVKQKVMEMNQHLIETDLSVEGLATGIYYLRIVSGSHRLTRRVVIE